MHYKGYVAHIEYDETAEIFHGRVELARDIVTFQGRSVEELKRELVASIEDYLAWCAERGEAPEQPVAPMAQAA